MVEPGTHEFTYENTMSGASSYCMSYCMGGQVAPVKAPGMTLAGVSDLRGIEP